VQLLSARWLLTRLLETRFAADSTGQDSLELLASSRFAAGHGRRRWTRAVKRFAQPDGGQHRPEDRGRSRYRPGAAARPRDWRAAECLRLLDYYNLQTRGLRPRSDGVFVDGRVAEVNGVLTALKDTLRRFYETNREWQTTPRLRFEEQRLNRRVQVQQQLLISLMEDLESAKIAEVNDVPVITVVDPPVPPIPQVVAQALVDRGSRVAAVVHGVRGGRGGARVSRVLHRRRSRRSGGAAGAMAGLHRSLAARQITRMASARGRVHGTRRQRCHPPSSPPREDPERSRPKELGVHEDRKENEPRALAIRVICRAARLR